MKLVMVRVDGL